MIAGLIAIAAVVLMNALPPALILGGSVLFFDPIAAGYTFTAVFVWKAVATIGIVLSRDEEDDEPGEG